MIEKYCKWEMRNGKWEKRKLAMRYDKWEIRNEKREIGYELTEKDLF